MIVFYRRKQGFLNILFDNKRAFMNKRTVYLLQDLILKGEKVVIQSNNSKQNYMVSFELCQFEDHIPKKGQCLKFTPTDQKENYYLTEVI